MYCLDGEILSVGELILTFNFLDSFFPTVCDSVRITRFLMVTCTELAFKILYLDEVERGKWFYF